MRFGIRGPRFITDQRRGAYRPKAESLEERLLLAIDLGGTTPPSLPSIATSPFGVQQAGGISSGGAGFSVADVGDVNNDGFDDFLVGGPTVVSSNGQINLGAGPNPQVYLIFGSASATATSITNWLQLDTTGSRVGDLAQLGNLQQTDPITGSALAAPFAGITFFQSSNPNSQLGASVAGLGSLGPGVPPAFIIGAPNATDVNSSNPGTGQAFVIFGGSSLDALVGHSINLDDPGGNQGVNFITLKNVNVGNAQTGMAVAGPGDIFNDGFNDVAVGAPGATNNGNSGAGQVYLIDGKALPDTTGTVNLQNVSPTGSLAGVIFGGATSGGEAGFSLAGAGDVDGRISAGNTRIADLLIGAPGISTAYLVYGGSSLANQAALVNGQPQILLSRIGIPSSGSTNVYGAVITGTSGDGTGWSVSTAGDFNNDDLSDILIGSPFANSNAGQASLLYGSPASGTPLEGNIPLSNIPASYSAALFQGGSGYLAGYSVSVQGKMNNNPANPVLVGAPGANNDSGSVFLIPGVTGGQIGTFSLTSAASTPLQATVLNFSSPGQSQPVFFGASVSGRLTQIGQKRTADSDLIADIIVGAPGYSAISGRGLDGAAMILEGAFIPINTPVSNAITTQIGVGQPFGPFVVNATTPTTLQIYVFSNNTITPAFAPFTDINPKTVVVNGVPFPNATIALDPNDENGDGIPDAIITVSPRSAIGLTSSTRSLTISGLTLSTAPQPNARWTGTAAITVTGAGGGGSVTATTLAVPVGLIKPTEYTPHFGPTQFTPGISALSAYDYKAIPIRKALQQYLPPRDFRMRILNYFYPSQFHFQAKRAGTGTFTLPQNIFDTSRFHGRSMSITFTHRPIVVPTQRQTERSTKP
jgi:hypothetical protein